MLSSLDRQLIELLGQKIAASKLSKGHPEAASGINQLLHQNDVPEFVWQNLTLNCQAANQAINNSLNSTDSKRVTLIGGRGKMGQFFACQLFDAGHRVDIIEQSNWDDAPELLDRADLVLLCVPINIITTVIDKAAPFLNPSAVLVDISSLKVSVVSTMLEYHQGPVVGLHPMFGPGVTSFLSQNVVVCPGRHLQACQWFLDLIENQGGNLVYCSPEEHDRLMGVVQAIRHFSVFGLGVFLAEEGVDLQKTLGVTSPLFRVQLDMVSRLFAQDGSLYLEIMLSNQENSDLIGRLAKVYARLAELVQKKDKYSLQQTFTSTRHFYQSQTTPAMSETNHLINSLTAFLAAKDKTKQIKQKIKTLLHQ
ncbi:bifunctional chorismate mutase/prephenate dehydrogenase [Cyanothece sp. BG0011]|uniref:bifunctional chorismate mutase/prephenate dehydrogenase n=1 Tax=Cyanothece sp. BG0011 TaxID=2082950 RepID=UPI000D1E5D82|nr:bifunctional chorismate mutase/prephenate dehydrogenase [Cyanothece sp. BG0011]